MIIKLLVEGGEMKMNPTIAQKLGPLGLNMGKIISDINHATGSFKGMKVPVILEVDPKTKTYKIEVSTPQTAELLKKELGIEKGAGASMKLKAGNAAIEQIIKIAKAKQEGMLVNNFKSAVKNVIGSCVSLGILIESKEPKEISREVSEGKYDILIKKQVTEASPEKMEKLASEFAVIKTEQEKLIKAEEEAKAAEEAAKAAAAPAGVAVEVKEGAEEVKAVEKVEAKAEEKKEEKKPKA